MKPASPLRSRPGPGGLLPGSRTRSKSPVCQEEEQVLSDMERCYRLLRAMVPGLRPDQSLSRVDLLQHVIDYILDLQTALEPGGPAACCQQIQHLQDLQDHRGTSPLPVLLFQPSDPTNRAWRERDAALTRGLNPDLHAERRTFSTWEV